jgi:amino acid transporter
MNYFNEKKFIKIENISVLMKIILFMFIILVGFLLNSNTINSNTINSNTINSNTINSPFNINIIILGFGAFLAYEGFEMISNVSYKLENKKRNIPLSYIISILIVGFIYMTTSWVTNKHLGNSIDSHNKFSSLISLVKTYGFTKIGPLFVVILCLISAITAINSTLFVNDRILNYFIKSLRDIDTFKLKTIFNYQIKLPIFKEKRKIAIWIGCIISSLLIFLPLIITAHIGSLSFFLIFIVICFLSLKLIDIKQKNKKNITIFNTKIPFHLSKFIVILSIIFCSCGSIAILYDIIKILILKK